MEKITKNNDVINDDVIIVKNLAEKTVKSVYFKIDAASSFFIQSYRNFTETLNIHVVIEIARFKMIDIYFVLMTSLT